VEDKRWIPDMDPVLRRRKFAKWQLAVEKTFGWEE
jgi:glycerol kinase